MGNHNTAFTVAFSNPGDALANASSVMHTLVGAYSSVFQRALFQGTDLNVPGNLFAYSEDSTGIVMKNLGGHWWSTPLHTDAVGAALHAFGDFYQRYNVAIDITVLRRNNPVATGRVFDDKDTSPRTVHRV